MRARAAEVGDVEVLTNLGGAELIELMKKVTVVWSLTGFTETENHNPGEQLRVRLGGWRVEYNLQVDTP